MGRVIFRQLSLVNELIDPCLYTRTWAQGGGGAEQWAAMRGRSNAFARWQIERFARCPGAAVPLSSSSLLFANNTRI